MPKGLSDDPPGSWLAAWAAKEALWLRKLLVTLLGNAQAVQMFCDNQGTCARGLMHNPSSHQRAKHVDVVHHFLLERVARGEIRLPFAGKKTWWQTYSRRQCLRPSMSFAAN
jgi:hypothetical protein